jgi:capsular exopolysaccharide synthesis family protein
MSKMYEALKKAQQHGVEVDVPVPITVEHTEVGNGTRTTPHEEAILHFESAPPPAPPRHANSSASQIREVEIHIAEGSPILPWAGDSHGGEQYRIIRTRIVQHPMSPRMMVVSSAGPGDGKTVSSVNIAGALSLRDNANVLLMDGDFRRSNVSLALGLPNSPGLANTLTGECTLQEAIIRVKQFPNLYVLTAGESRRNSAELLDTEHWKSLCATVRDRFSFVIIDAPPVAAVADYELIQKSCDGVIVVVRPDHTDRTLCNKAFELIPEEKRVGVVWNCAYDWFLWRTQDSYYYGSGAKH